MTLAFVHKGRTINLPLDVTTLSGNVQTDSTNAYIVSLVAGKVVMLGTNGVELCDGNTMTPIGFLVNNAAGYFFENIPALASGFVSVARGPENVVQTDQIDTTLTFNQGDLLYAGTGAKAGLVTNVSPGGIARLLGIALTPASASSTLLTVALA
jgi:hypothetical protein